MTRYQTQSPAAAIWGRGTVYTPDSYLAAFLPRDFLELKQGKRETGFSPSPDPIAVD
jgi:hypothetical protein